MATTLPAPTPVTVPSRRKPRFVLSLYVGRTAGAALAGSAALRPGRPGGAGLQALERLILGRAWLERVGAGDPAGNRAATLWTARARAGGGHRLQRPHRLGIAVMLMGRIDQRGGGACRPDRRCWPGSRAWWPRRWRQLRARPPRRPAAAHGTLIACGNSICGNSAIAAVAPVIGAKADDVATAIAFTAILGVAWCSACRCSPPPCICRRRGSAFRRADRLCRAPVLAATAPAGVAAVQIGDPVQADAGADAGPGLRRPGPGRPRAGRGGRRARPAAGAPPGPVVHRRLPGPGGRPARPAWSPPPGPRPASAFRTA